MKMCHLHDNISLLCFQVKEKTAVKCNGFSCGIYFMQDQGTKAWLQILNYRTRFNFCAISLHILLIFLDVL